MKRYVIKYLKLTNTERATTPKGRRLQSRTAMRVWHKNIMARPTGQKWLESAPKSSKTNTLTNTTNESTL